MSKASSAQAILQVQSDSLWQLSGCLNLNCMADLEQKVLNQLAGTSDNLQVDLSGVEHSDSSAIALLIGLWREANRLNKSIEFTHVPDQLRIIAQLSSLDHVLPLA